MKYIFELNHPKHYYQFKYIINILKSRGSEVLILARDKDVLLNILEEEKVDYRIFGEHKKSMVAKVTNTFSVLQSYNKIVKEFKPDFIVSKASLYGALIAKRLRIKSVIFPDSEVVKLTNKIVVPLSTFVITPEYFTLNYGVKHLRIPGMFENSYLAPSVFSPNKAEIVEYLKFPYAILRFVGWDANHDVNNGGFANEEKIKLAESLSKHLNVYVSSEKELPDELKKYALNTPKALIHQVLSFADLYVGDSQTMATEASLLGTPSIRSNSFVGEHDMSNFKVLENKFGLLRNVKSFDEVLEFALDFAQNSRKEEWLEKLAEYHTQVGDLNEYIADLIEKL